MKRSWISMGEEFVNGYCGAGGDKIYEGVILSKQGPL